MALPPGGAGRGPPAGPFTRLPTPGLAGYNVAWSPFYPDKLAVAGAANVSPAPSSEYRAGVALITLSPFHRCYSMASWAMGNSTSLASSSREQRGRRGCASNAGELCQRAASFAPSSSLLRS
ncbi:hypothetical protein L7F22_062316 [Adiantum nelumboides]|nr:hypothetical protein [Adiantum nelumboides]